MDEKNIHSNFFSATCVPEKLLILFVGLQCEAPLDLPIMYTSSTPAGPSPRHWKLCENDVSTYFALIPLRISFTFQIQYDGFNAALQELRSFLPF